MDMRPVSFNMLDPDFRFMTEDAKHGLILTVHAIEQIPEISPTLIDEILSRFEKVTVAHFEPITFQLPNQAQENPDRYARDVAHAEIHNHNRNLFSMLSSHPKVTNLEVTPAVWQAGEQHSVSLIKWQN